jgi:hypothetical protein
MLVQRSKPWLANGAFGIFVTLLFLVGATCLAVLPHHHDSAASAAHCETCLAHAAAGTAVLSTHATCATILAQIADARPELVVLVSSHAPLTLACRGPPTLPA